MFRVPLAKAASPKPMDHIDEETLKSLLEDRMSRVAKAQLRHHIRTCYRCEEKVRQWRTAIDALDEEPEAKPRTPLPPASEPMVLVPTQPVALSNHSRWIVRTVMAVAVVLVVALLVESIRQRRPIERDSAEAGTLITRSQAAIQGGMDSVPASIDSTTPVPAAETVTVPPSPTPASTDTAPGGREAAAPSAPPIQQEAPKPASTSPGFTVLTVREAIERTGGPIRLIRGSLPDHLEIAPASVVPGALPEGDVLRVVYREPGGRVLRLDQQRIPEAYREGLAPDTLMDAAPDGTSMATWVSGDTRITLSGRIDPETLMVFVRRVE